MNPFRFGNVVTGEYFTNRKSEIKEVISEIKSGQHIVLMSPRRYGKSSLVNEAMKAVKIKWFRIDMELITDEVDLANYYVRNALELSKFEKIKHYLKNLKIQPYIQIQPKTGEISVSFSAEPRNISTLLSDSFQLPETIAKSMKTKVIILKISVYMNKTNNNPIVSGTSEKIIPTILDLIPTNCSAPDPSQIIKTTKKR